MKVSVIIPAFNEEKLIGATLQSIREAGAVFQDYGWSMEIVVCDNNSKDRTAALAEAAGARVIFEPVNQIARARNAGASIATGEWFIFVDADSHPSAGLFRAVVEAIQTGKYLGGGATVVLDEKSTFGSAVTGLWNRLSRWRKWMAGSFIFCEANAFRVVQGFSLELYASEEINFSQKLRNYARSLGKDLVILTRHPLVTSARKLHLYSKGEYGLFLLKAAFRPRKILGDPQACAPWYDGRR